MSEQPTSSTPEGDDVTADDTAEPTKLEGKSETILVGEVTYTLCEMSGRPLQLWLATQLIAAQRMNQARRAGDPLDLLAAAQVVHLELVAQALGISTDEAFELPLSVRREIVRRQDKLNRTALYAAILAEEGAAANGY